jgi:hypothetical protein
MNQRTLWIGFTIAASSFLLAFFATSPYILLDQASFWRDVTAQRQSMEAGHFGLDVGSTWIYYLQSLFGRLLGPPLAVLSLVGLVYFTFFCRARWAFVLGGFLVANLLVFGFQSAKAERYLLPLLPVLTLFGSMAVVVSLRALFSRYRRRGYAWALTGAAVLVGLPYAAAYGALLERSRPDTRHLAKQWIEANVPEGVFIAMEAYGPELRGTEWLRSMGQERFRLLEGRGYTPPVYAIQNIPMFQVNPDRSTHFYELRLYDMADLIITSSSVEERYRQEPDRFHRQLAFYEALETHFIKLQEFSPGSGSGPHLSIYKSPRQRPLFAAREVVADPNLEPLERGQLSGGEAFFCYTLGLNYETFRFLDPALLAYARGLQYPTSRPRVRASLSLGVAHCLVGKGRANEAIAYLQEAEKRIPDPRERTSLRSLREELLRDRDESGLGEEPGSQSPGG